MVVKMVDCLVVMKVDCLVVMKVTMSVKKMEYKWE